MVKCKFAMLYINYGCLLNIMGVVGAPLIFTVYSGDQWDAQVVGTWQYLWNICTGSWNVNKSCGQFVASMSGSSVLILVSVELFCSKLGRLDARFRRLIKGEALPDLGKVWQFQGKVNVLCLRLVMVSCGSLVVLKALFPNYSGWKYIFDSINQY